MRSAAVVHRMCTSVDKPAHHAPTATRGQRAWQASRAGASSSLATHARAHNGRSLVYSAGHSDDQRQPAAASGAPTPAGRRDLFRRDPHQADVSTQEEVPAQDARVPHPYVDARWTPGAQGTPPQGPQAPDPRASTVTPRHRLHGRRRFAEVRAEGLRASASGVRAQLAGNHLEVARVGFALVGLRSAVQRNLLRRRLRDAVRPLLETLAGHDLVLVAGSEALGLPFSGLRDAVEVAATRALDRSRGSRRGSSADNGALTPSARPAP